MAEKTLERLRKPDRTRDGPATRPTPSQADIAQAGQRTEAERTLGVPYRAGPHLGLAPPVDPGNLLRHQGRGEPLPASIRRRFERATGRDASAVRVHRGAQAEATTRALSARALAHRNHIFLDRPSDLTNLRVIGHELAHVAQQGHAPRARGPAAMQLGKGGARSRPAVARPAATAPRQAAAAGGGGAVQRWPEIDVWGAARSVGGAVVSGASAVGGAVVSGARAVGGAVVSGVRIVGGVVTEGAETLMSMGRDALLGVVRRVAPTFLPLFQGGGIVSYIRGLVGDALSSLFRGLTAPLTGFFNIGSLSGKISQGAQWLSGLATEFAAKGCDAILNAARQVGDFFSSALSPVFDKIRSISDRVNGFFTAIRDAIAAPFMDILRRVGGTIWSKLQGFVRGARDAIATVRRALGSAWSRVKNLLGIGAEDGAEEGGGLWNWIKEKAASVGRAISSAIRPIAGPLRSAGAALLLLIPGGQLIAIYLMWPQISAAFNAIKRYWNDLNLIPRARAYLSGTAIPWLMSTAEVVAQTLLGGADWLIGLLDRIAAAFQSVQGAASGLLGPFAALAGLAVSGFRRILGLARRGIRYASTNFRSMVRKLVEFLQLILSALLRLIAIVANPFGITGFLLGNLWKMIPECLKGPIIDFILTIVLRILRAMPNSPMLGILFPVVKAAMIGFVERVRGYRLAVKVAVSNKIARIVAGDSVSFFFGYVTGLAVGVFRGITAPFTALATIFELPTLLQEFLANLGVRLCEIVEQIRCFAAELAGRVFGSVDDVLAGLSELLADPARIVDLIRCAIEGLLAGASNLGSQLAGQLMGVLMGPESGIGRKMGEITGELLLQAVITYFTAGVGTAVSIGGRIGSMLASVGRAIRTVVNTLRGLFGQLVGFLKGFAARFASGVARGAQSVLGRLGGFFKRVAAWFGKLFARLGRLARKFFPSVRQRGRFALFKVALSGRLKVYAGQGARKQQVRAAVSGIRGGFMDVVRWPVYITKHNGKWRVWARMIKTLRPDKVGEVKQDNHARFRAGAEEVRDKMRRVKDDERNVPALNRILGPIKRKYDFTRLEAVHDESEDDFDIMGAMSPKKKITEVDEAGFATFKKPLSLDYPKPPSSQYPTIYVGPYTTSRGPRISQSTLRSARSSNSAKQAILAGLAPRYQQRWQDRGLAIDAFRPHGSKALPHGLTLGITPGNRTRKGKKLKLNPGSTEGGRKLNRALKRYGYSPSNEGLDADHVVERQLGGPDAIGNLWPLDSSTNRAAGSRLSQMNFKKPDKTMISMSELKTEAGKRDVWLKITKF